jgi:hypothetical protein
MACRVERDGSGPPALAPDTEGDLLRHRPRGHEDGCFLADELGDPPLEALDALARAVHVGTFVLIGHLREPREHFPQRWLAVRRVEEALCAAGDGPDAFLVGHDGHHRMSPLP